MRTQNINFRKYVSILFKLKMLILSEYKRGYSEIKKATTTNVRFWHLNATIYQKNGATIWWKKESSEVKFAHIATFLISGCLVLIKH